MSKGTILSGMRPTGKLHMGHMSVLENWVRMQSEYNCYFMVADWHALSTEYNDPTGIREKTVDMVIDWLTVGIDPEQSVIFVQSDVKEHAELHLLFSMITPLSWLERVPTYKEQLIQLGGQGKDINTYGFLGYPLLQAADILVYKATAVPVGEDQLPHLELTREVARRFNHLFGTKVFPEPKSIVGKVSLLPGVDGRKMSKSYGNFINIAAATDEVSTQVRAMITDPARIHKTDPGHPDVCTVHTYHTLYNKGDVGNIAESCRAGSVGCVACKKALAEKLEGFLLPMREKRAQMEQNLGYIDELLAEGAKKARALASDVMAEVRTAMKMV